MYRTRWVLDEGIKWYNKSINSKYTPNKIIDKEILRREFPSIVWQIEQLRMTFIFYQPTKCNLHLTWFFNANWDPDFLIQRQKLGVE